MLLPWRCPAHICVIARSDTVVLLVARNSKSRRFSMLVLPKLCETEVSKSLLLLVLVRFLDTVSDAYLVARPPCLMSWSLSHYCRLFNMWYEHMDVRYCRIFLFAQAILDRVSRCGSGGLRRRYRITALRLHLDFRD